MKESENPWNSVDLDDYEQHMSLSSVMQLQMLDTLMSRQLADYSVSSVCILGIAGGNGLRHVDPHKIERVYGVDINGEYLKACECRYPGLKGCFHPLRADLTGPCESLPQVDEVVADLFIEYVGYDNFARAVVRMGPRVVSCVIQEDTDESFVSESPYADKLDILSAVHTTIDEETLSRSMRDIGYERGAAEAVDLPNGKRLRRIDYVRRQGDSL